MQIADEVIDVLDQEIHRQRRTLGEVCRKAGVHKNALYKAARPGATLRIPTLWAICKELGVPVSEIMFRVEQRERVATA